jgi:hypothetical protein
VRRPRRLNRNPRASFGFAFIPLSPKNDGTFYRETGLICPSLLPKEKKVLDSRWLTGISSGKKCNK